MFKLYFTSFIAALLLLNFTTTTEARTGKAFDKLEDCHLLQNSSNDGDRFHVKNKGSEYIFRLYFVDAPETENEFPARVNEQAKYFELTPKEAIEIGKTAAAFTKSKLAGKSFTIYTHWQNARGQSKLPRYYAFVIIDNQNLDDLLVSNGLARIFGLDVYSPDGLSPKAFATHLRVLEDKAKHDHLGAWSVHAPKSAAHDESWGKFFPTRSRATPAQ